MPQLLDRAAGDTLRADDAVRGALVDARELTAQRLDRGLEPIEAAIEQRANVVAERVETISSFRMAAIDAVENPRERGGLGK